MDLIGVNVVRQMCEACKPGKKKKKKRYKKTPNLSLLFVFCYTYRCNVSYPPPGGLVLLSCRHGPDNMEYTAALEREVKQMEDEGLWRCVAVTPVEKWLRSAIASGDYVPGSLYLYKKV